MATKKDIEAGRAYVLLAIKNNLEGGLKKASLQLKAFGKVATSLGTAMAGVGAAVAAPLAAAVASFAKIGSEINDMSARTGMAAEGLSALGYAAGMTGASMADVETSIRKMQVAIAGAAAGSESAVNALATLGLTVDQLQGLNPEQQFSLLADGLASIADPGERAAAAVAIFGRGGTALLPMLAGGAAGLAEFRKEAETLGLVMSTQDAAAADALGDAMDRVLGSVRGLTMQIGAALAPVITDISGRISAFVAGISGWIAQNQQLVVNLAGVAAGLVAGGTAIIALGGAAAMASTVLGGLSTVVAIIGGLLGAIVSPIGLVVAGVVALTGVLIASTGTWSYVTTQLGTVWQTISGLAQYLLAGEWGKAWEFAKAGAMVFLSTLGDLFDQLPGLAGYAIGRMARAIYDGFAAIGRWVTNFVVSIQQAFDDFFPKLIRSMLSGGGMQAAIQETMALLQKAIGTGLEFGGGVAAGWNKTGGPGFQTSVATRQRMAEFSQMMPTGTARTAAAISENRTLAPGSLFPTGSPQLAQELQQAAVAAQRLSGTFDAGAAQRRLAPVGAAMAQLPEVKNTSMGTFSAAAAVASLGGKLGKGPEDKTAENTAYMRKYLADLVRLNREREGLAFS